MYIFKYILLLSILFVRKKDKLCISQRPWPTYRVCIIIDNVLSSVVNKNCLDIS